MEKEQSPYSVALEQLELAAEKLSLDPGYTKC